MRGAKHACAVVCAAGRYSAQTSTIMKLIDLRLGEPSSTHSWMPRLCGHHERSLRRGHLNDARLFGGCDADVTAERRSRRDHLRRMCIPAPRSFTSGGKRLWPEGARAHRPRAHHPAHAYLDAQAIRRTAPDHLSEVFETVDLLLSPVTPEPAPPRETTGDQHRGRLSVTAPNSPQEAPGDRWRRAAADRRGHWRLRGRK